MAIANLRCWNSCKCYRCGRHIYGWHLFCSSRLIGLELLALFVFLYLALLKKVTFPSYTHSTAGMGDLGISKSIWMSSISNGGLAFWLWISVDLYFFGPVCQTRYWRFTVWSYGLCLLALYPQKKLLWLHGLTSIHISIAVCAYATTWMSRHSLASRQQCMNKDGVLRYLCRKYDVNNRMWWHFRWLGYMFAWRDDDAAAYMAFEV